MAYQFDSAEELLSELRAKIENDITFETKREIVKTLVEEIIVETIEPLEGGRKKAIVNIRYSFNKSRGVLHTGKDS